MCKQFLQVRSARTIYSATQIQQLEARCAISVGNLFHFAVLISF